MMRYETDRLYTQTQWWINNLKKKKKLSKVTGVESAKNPLTIKSIFLSKT